MGSAHPQNTLQTVFVIGRNGKVIGGNGPPGLANNWTDAVALTGKPILTLLRGSKPDAPREIALDVATVEKGGLQGRRPGPAGDAGQPAGAEGHAHRRGRVRVRWPQRGDPDDLRPGLPPGHLLRRPGRLLLASPSTPRPASRRPSCATAARTVLPDGLRGAHRRGRSSRTTRRPSTRCSASCRPSCSSSPASRWSSASFLIINTFSILVAQRSRELGAAAGAGRLPQAGQPVGARSRRWRSGLIGSTVGLGRRATCSRSASAALFGADRARPQPGRVPGDLARRSRWSYGVGVVVTAFAAYPARPPRVAGSHRSRRCATTSRCRSPRCAAGSWSARRWSCSGAGAMVVGLAGEGNAGLSGSAAACCSSCSGCR